MSTTMTSQSVTQVTFPNQTLKTLLQPVSSCIRNCLIIQNEKMLTQLDWNHLQGYSPIITDEETTFTVQVLVKQVAEATYKLESKQIFEFSRIDAENALSSFGLAHRYIPKAQYEDFLKFIADVGSVEVVDGDANSEFGDLTVLFRFGTPYKDFVPARYIDLGSDKQVAEDYSLIFRGQVKFVFQGKEDPNKETTPPEVQPDPERPVIDLAVLLPNRDLGKVFGKNNTPTA